MKCFIHNKEEAIAVCKNCGKAMCANCSSYSEHSGICPECIKVELEKEYQKTKSKIVTTIIAVVVITVGILIWMIKDFNLIVPFILLFPLCIGLTLIDLNKKKTKLKLEIEKLNAALEQGNRTI